MKLVQLNEDLANLDDKLKDRVRVALDDTQAQVALETDEKKKEVKKDTKPAVDASNDIAKKTNADGKAKEIFEALNADQKSDLLDRICEDIEEALNPIMAKYQDELNIESGDIAPVHTFVEEQAIKELAKILIRVLDAEHDDSIKVESLTEAEIGHSGEMVGEPIEPEEYGVDTAVTDLIKRGWENIDQVNSIKATFESLPESLKTALDCILDDNMIHIGLLENAIGKVPSEEVETEERIELEEV